MLARAKASASSKAPEDRDFAEDFPCCWWAFNQRKDDAGNGVPGATLTLFSDGPFYVGMLSLRQVNAQTSFRFESMLGLLEAMEAVLSDPGTIWRESPRRPGQQKK